MAKTITNPELLAYRAAAEADPVRAQVWVGLHKARIAVARKLAIIMFGIWRDGTHFQFKADTVVAHREMMQAARA